MQEGWIILAITSFSFEYYFQFDIAPLPVIAYN